MSKKEIDKQQSKDIAKLKKEVKELLQPSFNYYVKGTNYHDVAGITGSTAAGTLGVNWGTLLNDPYAIPTGDSAGRRSSDIIQVRKVSFQYNIIRNVASTEQLVSCLVAAVLVKRPRGSPTSGNQSLTPTYMDLFATENNISTTALAREDILAFINPVYRDTVKVVYSRLHRLSKQTSDVGATQRNDTWHGRGEFEWAPGQKLGKVTYNDDSGTDYISIAENQLVCFAVTDGAFASADCKIMDRVMTEYTE